MEGPRPVQPQELPHVISFLNHELRKDASWSISSEYPTALSSHNIHNMRVIKDQEQIVSHAVLKPLIVKSPHVIFKVGAIGSVVTNETYRQQGHSRRLILECIQEATNQNCDVAVLWTNLYDFYRKMGFELAGSEISLHLAQQLSAPPQNLKFSQDPKVSPEALFRLYNTHTVGAVRTLDDIKKFLAIPKTQLYTAWDQSGKLVAFAVEGKGADLNGYLHEWAGSVSALIALVSWIQTQKNSALTLIAPKHAQNLIAQIEAQGALKNNGFLGMIKILNIEQLATKIKKAFRAEGVSDFVLEKTPNGSLVFGVNKELYTLQNETDLLHLLFGPVDYNQLDFMTPPARAVLSKILPLPLWLWGWDSV